MIKNVKSPTEMSGLYFVYNGATSLEKKGWYGLAHFLEHLVSKNYDDLQNTLQENGIDWNAYTSNNQIVFYFTGLEKYLAPYRDVLIERSKTFRATPEDCEKEKKIVLEEYLDCFTQQGETHILNFERRQYGSYEPIGLREDIEKFTYQDCLDFFALQYQQPDFIISVAKDFELVRPDLEFADRLPLLRSEWTPQPDTVFEGSAGDSGKTSLLYDRFIDPQDAALLTILNQLMAGGLNAPLYEEIREKRGLVYFLYCYLLPLGTQYVQRIYTMTSHENVELFESAVREVLAKRDEHLTEQRLHMVRKSMQIQQEKAAINRYKNVAELLNPLEAGVASILDTVNLDDLRRVYDTYFNLDTYVRDTLRGTEEVENEDGDEWVEEMLPTAEELAK